MARKITSQSINFSKKDFINSRNGQALQEVAGERFKILSCATILDEDADKDENKNVGVLVTDKGVFTTISDNIIESIGDIIDVESEEGAGEVEVEIKMRKSKQGRDFLTLTIF